MLLRERFFVQKGVIYLKAENCNQKNQPQESFILGNKDLELARKQKDLCREYIKLYKKKSDEQLYQYLRDIADELGRVPKKSEVPAFGYIKSRLGKWPRILEDAGIKPVRKKLFEEIEPE